MQAPGGAWEDIPSPWSVGDMRRRHSEETQRTHTKAMRWRWRGSEVVPVPRRVRRVHNLGRAEPGRSLVWSGNANVGGPHHSSAPYAPLSKLVRSLGKISGAAACCGMLRHAAACCGMLQPALVGTYASVSS